MEGATEVPDETGGKETEGRKGKKPAEVSYWDRVLELIQAAFGEGKLVEENMCQEVILIPKGEKDYRSIGLVEVMWKLVAEVLNFQITASINFHDFLHGFRAGFDMGTATLEPKLLHQLAALRGGPVCDYSGPAQGV